MLAGISFQLAIVSIFFFVTTEFYWRYFTDRPLRGKKTSSTPRSSETLAENERGAITGKMVLVNFGLLFTTLLLWIRAVYRVIELADGWNGRIISTEVYFSECSPRKHFIILNADSQHSLFLDALDAMMVVLSMICWNFIHPGFFLPPKYNSDIAEKKATVQV